MSKILINQTAGNIPISDMGIIVPASGQYVIIPTEYTRWAGSSDVVTEVGNGNLVVNDGSEDLSITDGIDLIKGIFQKNRIIGDTDGTLIGNVDDAMKVAGLLIGTAEDKPIEVQPSLPYQSDINKMMCLFEEIIRQLRINNEHLAKVSDLEDLDDPEEGNDGL